MANQQTSPSPPAPRPQSGSGQAPPKPQFPANIVFRNDQQVTETCKK